MIYTGSKLAEARKAKDMTQMELADKLGISFQAVSSWERGNSMPDISKLPELAQILDITIDELLGKSAPLIDSVIAGNAENYIEENDVSVDEIIEAAPIMKPSQTENIAAKMSEKRSLSELDNLFPFLGREVCDELFKKAITEKNYHGIEDIAPFVSRETINEVLLENVDTDFPIGDIACFADRKIIGQIALRQCMDGGIRAINDDILPFIDKGILNDIADEAFKGNGLRDFDDIAPFVDRDKLCELAALGIERDGIRAISDIAPFLGREFLAKYVREKYL